MKTRVRGVKVRIVGRASDGSLIREEVVCVCRCHDIPGVMHFIACCGVPQTEKGKLLLENYGKTIPTKTWEELYKEAIEAVVCAKEAIDEIAGWSGSSGNWPLQEASGRITAAINVLCPLGESKP